MDTKMTHVLLFEDNPGDARLFREYLHETELIQIELDHVDRLKTGLEHLAQKDPDIILLDLGLPDSQGLETFTQVYAQAPNVPIIILTGLNEANLSVEAVRGGAQDHLVKGEISSALLVRSIRYAIERKQVEEALRFQTQIMDQVHEVIVTTDLKGLIISWNTGAEKLLGYSEEETLGKPITMVYPLDQLPLLTDVIQPQVRKKGWHDIEVRFRNKSGKEIPVHLTLAVLKNSKGQIIGMTGSAIDISERKQTEEALKKSEEDFKYVFDHSPVGKSLTKTTGEINVNQAFCDILGYSQQELKFKKWQVITHPDDIEMTQKEIDALLSGEKKVARFTKRFIHKDGSIVWVDISSSVRYNEEGKPQYLMTSVLDITERKRAESKILESEERYRSLFMNMLNGFAYCRMLFDQNDAQDFIYLEVNDAFEKLTDFKNVVGKKATEVIPGIREADPELFKLYGDVALTGKPKTFEIYIKSLREWHSVTLYSPRKGYFISIFEVITERKQAEIALQVSQRGLEEAQNLAGIGSWEYDIAADKTIWSKKMFDLFGRDPALGEPSWQEHRPYIHPDDWETLDSAVKSGKGYNIEFRLLHPACGVRWSHTIALTESDENGKVVKLKGTVQDITESKLAEEKISNQLDELLRWQNVMLDREERIQELKQEVNLLLNNGSQPPRYASD